MPTAARLVSALFMALVGYLVSQQYMDAVLAENPDANFGNMLLINVLVGAIVGWVLLGWRVGHSYSVSIGLGVTAMVAAVFWCLFCHAIWEMLQRSLDRRFDGPIEAIIGAIGIGIEQALPLLEPHIFLTLFATGVIGGMLAEFVSRRWR